ncbi:holocytochrome c synthase [Modicella reniformis]|uniref:Holocytochrome c-type synthase n=1 Tax=Modicella reniformis TaxID=1440133 RepID=A0A9P6ST81_9FUNG|nr:holocytochrome c synthase [Modicella reniformis]
MSPGKDTTATSPPPSCPMHQPATAAAAAAAAPKPKPPPGCPMHRSEDGASSSSSNAASDNLNPDNNIPNLAQSPFPDQETPLPTERVISSIPRAKSDEDSKWEYPSPQQFYNALRRKGWETPENAIETMVDIHNWMNEEAWGEVMKWEKEHADTCCDPKLLRFQGRPSTLSPKASAPKPFDRHDWIIDRCGKEVRYVIDYYGGQDDIENDVPVFHLDVRPALDSFESAMDRLKFGVRDTFARLRKESETSPSKTA